MSRLAWLLGDWAVPVIGVFLRLVGGNKTLIPWNYPSRNSGGKRDSDRIGVSLRDRRTLCLRRSALESDRGAAGDRERRSEWT